MLDVKQIMDILPHRFPFLMVDRILEITPGVRAVGIKNVTINEPFFCGHWPGNPVMPGVLVLEAMAQVGGIMLLTLTPDTDQIALFGGVQKARFRHQVNPGDQLRLEVEMVRRKGAIGRVKATATVDAKVVADAELTFALSDTDQAGATEWPRQPRGQE
jgi:3-hydroxyacyl-[acyl-carrier-protein] dehydratase